MVWEVGQRVWVVPRDNRNKPHAAVVGKVARKWVTFDPPWRGRFDRATGEVDGGRDYCPTTGQCSMAGSEDCDWECPRRGLA